jgi:hypothetical protein
MEEGDKLLIDKPMNTTVLLKVGQKYPTSIIWKLLCTW